MTSKFDFNSKDKKQYSSSSSASSNSRSHYTTNTNTNINATTATNHIKLNEIKYNRVVLNSVRLPDTSEYDEEQYTDASTSVNLNSDFSSFSSNENNLKSSGGFSDIKDSFRVIGSPVGCATIREERDLFDEFKFLKFDPFDRFISRLSGKSLIRSILFYTAIQSIIGSQRDIGEKITWFPKEPLSRLKSIFD